ncbi:MAG: hypothetical protein AAFZ65_16470, partial [Planctomycetota bacterium]
MTAQPPDDELFELALTEGLTHPRVRDRVERDPEFAAEVERLAAVTARLDQAGAMQRETFEQAARESLPEGFELVARRAAGLEPEASVHRPRFRRGALGLLVAAAAVALIWIGTRPDAADPTPDFSRIFLGGDFDVRVEELADGPLSIVWERAPGTGGWFQVRILVRDASGQERYFALL